MAERVWRMTIAAMPPARVMVGMTMSARFAPGSLVGGTYPEGGSQRSHKANNRISSRPSQKGGMDAPIIARTVPITSDLEFGFTAEMIPTGMAISTPRSMAMAESWT